MSAEPITLTPEQQAILERLVARGLFPDAATALDAALDDLAVATDDARLIEAAGVALRDFEAGRYEVVEDVGAWLRSVRADLAKPAGSDAE